MSGPDRLPDSGIYLVGVEGLGGRVAELFLTQGPDKHFPYRGSSLPFVATGAGDSALPITLVRRTITQCYHIHTQEADTHSHMERETTARELLKKKKKH